MNSAIEMSDEDRDDAFAEMHALCWTCDEPTCDVDQCACACAPRPVRAGKRVYCSAACKAVRS